MTPELFHLRALLREARAAAYQLPYTQDMVVTLDDLIEEIDFLAAISDTEARP